MPNDFMGSEYERAEVSRARGKAAAAIKDPKKRREYIARQGKLETFGGGWEATLRRLLLEHGKVGPKYGFERLAK